MLLFVERYLLPLLVGIAVYVLVGTSWQLHTRGAVAVIVSLIAFAIAFLATQRGHIRPAPRSNHLPAVDAGSMKVSTIATVPDVRTPAALLGPYGTSPDGVAVEEPAPEKSRQYVEIDLNRFSEFFERLTSANKNPETSAYIGSWTRFRVPIQDVNIILDRIQVWHMGPGIDIDMYFSEKWHNQLRHLNQGDIVTIEGKIARLLSHRIDLEECELVNL
jgi:hypothetical protein